MLFLFSPLIRCYGYHPLPCVRPVPSLKPVMWTLWTPRGTYTRCHLKKNVKRSACWSSKSFMTRQDEHSLTCCAQPNMRNNIWRACSRRHRLLDRDKTVKTKNLSFSIKERMKSWRRTFWWLSWDIKPLLMSSVERCQSRSSDVAVLWVSYRHIGDTSCLSYEK